MSLKNHIRSNDRFGFITYKVKQNVLDGKKRTPPHLRERPFDKFAGLAYLSTALSVAASSFTTCS